MRRPMPDRPHRRSPLLLLIALGTILASACSATTAATDPSTGTASTAAAPAGSLPGGRLRVAAAFYPIAEAVGRVGGDRVTVQDLTPPGGGPHDLELTPQQVDDLSRQQLVVYLSKGFQPQVERAVAALPSGIQAVDVLEGIELLPVRDQLAGTQGEVDGEQLEGGFDPHVWVDPVLQIQIATRIHDHLVAMDPSGRAGYDAGLAAYREELTALDRDLAGSLATCDSKVIVTSHRAFEYLARRYGLTQIPIAGISPDEEPDPRTLEAVAAAARENGVKVVFFEEQVPPDLARTVAQEIGARTDVLDPVETITGPDLAAGSSYTSIMRDNLRSLREGLGCR